MNTDITSHVEARHPAALSERAAADWLGISLIYLQRLRTNGVGPRYSRLGRRVIYRTADLDSFLIQTQTKEVHRSEAAA